MSADNGIYILKMTDQCRVICTKAIDNLFWSYVTNSVDDKIVSTRIIEYFCNAKPLSFNDAQKQAFIYEEIVFNSPMPYLEYGIQVIRKNCSWNEIVEEAANIAELELKNIKKSDYTDRTQYLEKLIHNKEHFLTSSNIIKKV